MEAQRMLIPYLRDANGRYYRILGSNGPFWKVYPAGGGFTRHVLKDAPGATLAPQLPDPTYTPQIAVGDWDEVEYQCVGDPVSRWNGWAAPWFTLSVTNQIIKDTEWVLLRTELDGTMILGLPEDEDFNENQREITAVTRKEINGETRYAFDGWCWNFKSDFEEED